MLHVQGRVLKIKEAKIEAEKSVAKHRAEKEAVYQALVSKQVESGAASVIDAQSANDIAVMSRDFQAKKAGVEQMLVDLVLKVDVKVPRSD